MVNPVANNQPLSQPALHYELRRDTDAPLGPFVATTDDNGMVLLSSGEGLYEVVDWVGKRMVVKVQLDGIVGGEQTGIAASNGKVYVCSVEGDFNCGCGDATN